ncbi:hypothetical protein HDV62DRAFT_335409 [Trichoderma sp. SZMC 28011]
MEDRRMRKLKRLVDWSVDIAGNMLCTQDSHDQTGLHKAIHHKNRRMIRYVLEAYDKYSKSRDWNLDQVLGIPSALDGNNIVHLAIKDMTPVPQTDEEWLNMINKIIDAASAKTLKMQNKDGLTPLHLAVEGGKCNSSQFQIVEKLIHKCDDALDVHQHNNESNSVYQHHIKTYAEWKKADEMSESFARVAESRDPKWHGASADEQGLVVLTVKVGEAVQGDQKLASDPSLGSRTEKSSNEGELILGEEAISIGGQRTESQFTEIGEQSSPPSGGTDQQKLPVIENVTEESATNITEYLKHTYLRNKTRQDCLDFLYGGIAEKQVDFNIYGKEGEISEKDFKLGYKCANLEDTLLCVRIPYLIIKPTAPEQQVVEQTYEQLAKLSDSTSKGSPIGRTDLGIVFDWLRNDANVGKIIKLIVDDSHHPPHSDEEIEKAVKPFQVEVWDWQKIDLCCETIAEAAPQARQVNLYWSGNNAVLRGWSDPEGGLARLPYLKEVNVFPQSRGIESRGRNADKFQIFKQRLEQHAHKGGRTIKVNFYESAGTMQKPHTSGSKNDDVVQIYHWHKCMEKFGRFFRQVDRKFLPKPEPIRIAVIDDGIDTTEPRLHNYIVGGQCFCSNDESPSFCVSAGGHGTTMARLISWVFPQAKILSLKLDEYTQNDGTSQFSVSSATKAIRWAIAAGVSIINMSWSIERTEANVNELDELRKAVNEAENAKILMFCSTNDQGKTKDDSYPGAFKRHALCRIGAATATGEETNYVSLEDVDFLFPGREIEQDQGDDTLSNGVARPKDRSVEGSSLATAFASGLAGLILYLSRLVGVYYRNDNDPVLRMIDGLEQDPGKMKPIFEKLMTKKKFVEVWRAFENADEQSRTGGRDESNKFEILSDICSKLMNNVV